MVMTILVCAVLLLNLHASKPHASSSKDCIDIGIGAGAGGSSLQFDLYFASCPQAEDIVFSGVQQAIAGDPRMAASLLRLHFHDCFVNGCDASVLLDDTPNLTGEKTAGPNLNSLRGFDVVDGIKSELEAACPRTVSCADLLAIAARDAVVLSGGPTWQVEVGRKDSLAASLSAANSNIPAPTSDVATLAQNFQNVGLSTKDMVVLSGAHTIGKARCSSFSSRFSGDNGGNGDGDGDGDEGSERMFVASLQQLCAGSNGTLAHLDLSTPATFDNQYYVNLLSGQGLLQSDQVLAADGAGEDVAGLVRDYAADPMLFFEDFKASMVRMGRLSAGGGVGGGGEVRRSCRVVN